MSSYCSAVITAIVVFKQKKKKRYKRGSLEVSKREKQRIENQSKDEKALDMIRPIYPQCAKCLYHFKSPQLLEKHVCTGTTQSWDALSVAMRHADQLLARMDFSITGAIDKTASMFLVDSKTSPYAMFELSLIVLLVGPTRRKTCTQSSPQR